jgi:predicted transposase/invertase (TIGR01784 family)
MHNDFDTTAKEILNLSDRAIVAFLNACLGASFPPEARVTRANAEYRLPSLSGKRRSRPKTIVADKVLLVEEAGHCHVEIQLCRKPGMAFRMFRYDIAEALEHPTEKDGVWAVNFPRSMVIYLEPAAGTPERELLRVFFPDGARYNYSTPVIKLTELSVKELAELHLVIFAPLYLLKLRKRVKRARTHEKREELAAELKKIYGELDAAMVREEEAGNMTEMDRVKILDMTEVLHQKLYGEYTEFEEEFMGIEFPNLRIIEKAFAERDEERRLREEAVSKAELDRQRLKDAARNILKAGQPVEQVAQWTGLPLETVQMLAAQF